MKISQVKIENFRGYKDKTEIYINDLTVFVGKNDVGKSTILEALDIFFNEDVKEAGTVTIEKDDINKQSEFDDNKDIVISVVFDDLPDKIDIDHNNKTSLEQEYLLRTDKKLEIIKKFPNAGKAKVSIFANHPTNPKCNNLLSRKQKELQDMMKELKLDSNRRTNAEMRKAIWNKYKDELNCQEREIDANKDETKDIWEKLKQYMPLYTLFKADRENDDGDDEVQKPMKSAVDDILADDDIKEKLKIISDDVLIQLQEVAEKSLEKLAEINPSIAEKLKVVIPLQKDLKWANVFKGLTISGKDDIPINKRGSGVKRLILISFFKAEAERRQADKTVSDIIYAIEEPETSQHAEYQKILIDSFVDLSTKTKTQIILTTHSPAIVKMLKFENLRLVKDQEEKKDVVNIEENSLPYPSLNEVNFLAFGESDETYHNELYGFIADEDGVLPAEFKAGKEKRNYKRKGKKGNIVEADKIISEYIRHQIHHPENKLNAYKHTHEDLQQSIKEMRNFIKGNKATQT
ncbi:MAG: ATP-binding protein [Proteobacteria bacterium]|nr:ATP-binding protein [Pseudomonadota bacterium]